MATKRPSTADAVLGPCHESKSPQTAAIPLAQAAPRIGCERPPSMACDGRGPNQFGRAHGTRRPGPIGDRGQVRRACDKVVRFVKGRPAADRGSTRLATAGSTAKSSPRCLRSVDPSAENRRPAGAGQKSLGTLLPQSRRRRFGNDLLRQTGLNHSAQPVRTWPTSGRSPARSARTGSVRAARGPGYLPVPRLPATEPPIVVRPLRLVPHHGTL